MPELINDAVRLSLAEDHEDLLAIEDDKLTVILIKAGHRRDVYR